jgi:hypothetical protein
MNGLLLGMMVGAFAGFVAGGITMAVLAAAARDARPSHLPRRD